MKVIVNSVLLLLLLSVTAHAQLRELEITPIQNNRIPVFRNHPEMAAVIVNSSLTNLRLDSNMEVIATLGNQNQGEYILIVRPVRQIITINAPGFQQARLSVALNEPEQVLQYRIEPKPEVVLNLIPTNIQVTPADAIVSIDGNRVDISKPIPVEVGTHKIRIEKQGFRTIEKEVRISADQNLISETLTAIDVVPITIKTQPAGASVLLDGVQLGVTDHNGDIGRFRFPGTYELSVQLSGHVSEIRTITVSESGPNVTSITLIRNAGILRLAVSPSDAIVTINEEPFGASLTRELAPGSYRLNASKSGYISQSETIEVIRGQTVDKEIVLERNAGVLRLNVYPPDAMVLLNRQSHNPSEAAELAPGMVLVEVSKFNYDPFSESVEIVRGQTASRSITLTPHLGGFQITPSPMQASWSLTDASGKVVASGTGLARKSGIPVGNYTLVVKASGHQDLSETIRIERDRVIERNVILKEGPDLCGSSITDIDGNTYKTVKIGTQCWMAENLKTTKYRDGSPIENVTHNSQFADLTTGAWVFYDNNAPNNTTFGKLYNWHAVADARNVCPVGWHVPSDDEWTNVSDHLGTDPGFKMKSTLVWLDGKGSNISGFTGLPGGSRNINGTFSLVSRVGGFWSSTQFSTSKAWGRLLGSGTRDLIRSYYEKSNAYSVRCLRD